MMRSALFLILFFLGGLTSNVQAQNLERFKTTIDTLCAPSFHGRGYVNAGDKMAAFYLAKRFQDLGLKKFEDTYFQNFRIPVNTFPDKVELSINGKPLKIGKDFIMDPSSPGGVGKDQSVYYLKKKHVENPDSYVADKKRADKVIVFEGVQFSKMVKSFLSNDANAVKVAQIMYKTALQVTDKKLTAWMSQKPARWNTFVVKKEALPKKIKSVSYHVEAVFEEDYISQNVIGYIEGKTQPDSFIVIGGHYDHLGHMGSEAYFPGANDNASGVAMILELAHYFSKPENQPDKSIMFIAFGGEEVGLIGSKYYCQNPYVDLDKVSFMLSLDLFGAGSKGITAVCGNEFTKEFNMLKEANSSGNYLTVIKPRKATSNSDHYFFYKNGVRCFFLYAMGNLTAYHDVNDKAEVLEYDQFEKVFGVLKAFVEKL